MITIVAAAGNVIFYGWLAWFFAGRIGTPAQARFAGCFLAIGFAIGSFGGHAGSEAETVLALRGGGYLLGIVAFTMLLFRQHTQSPRRQP
ncbi:MAG: hypothetical protein EOO77_22540 [Oxalobacteraceae bacterium]|nr:MAG: hypothetical protein EOO77_22540 [Oxalobacteraceae bacterium]